MTDYRAILEHDLRGIGPADFGIEQLRRKRDRKKRNQRVGAIVLSLVVAIISLGAAYRIFQHVNRRQPIAPNVPAGQIVFGRFDPSAVDQVTYVVNTDGSGLQQISAGTAEVPRWSPNGTRISSIDGVI